MAVTEVKRTGFLGNLLGSFVAIPIGILLFLASFALLFKNEGCTEWGRVAQEAIVADAAAPGHDGAFVSVTGTLGAGAPVGDTEYLAPGPWLTVERVAEQYAWVEHSTSETRDKVGGGTETVTTYTYATEWTASPQDSSSFRESSGHQNVAMRYGAASFSAERATIGAWSLATAAAQLPSGRPLVLGAGAADAEAARSAGVQRLGAIAGGTVDGQWVYVDGAPSAPRVGDHRIGFRVVPTGGVATAFGTAQGGTLAPYMHGGDEAFLRLLEGSRDEAIAQLELEDTVRKWGLRFAGFLMMWIGLQMLFAPLHAIAGILPIAKKASQLVVGGVTLLIAAPLSIVTIVVSMVLHSVVALVIVGALCAGGGWWLWRRRQARADVGPPPGPPPAGAWGAPPGPPPA